MSKQYLNNKWCVRCERKEPTPYLRKNIKLFPKNGIVLDVGCGNGRNSIFMKKNNYDVVSVDMINDFGKKIILGKDKLPKNNFDIILANFIFMFLNKKERKQVFKQIQLNSKIETIMVVELYNAKDAFECNIDDIIHFFYNWEKIRKSKDKCILKKVF